MDVIDGHFVEDIDRIFIGGVFGGFEDNLGARPLPGIWTLEHFCIFVELKSFTPAYLIP